MQTLTEQLLEEGLGDRILTDTQLSRLVTGSSQRRYNLVNRAMKAGELIRLRRGLYMLPEKYRRQPCHPYALAQNLAPGSYVSLETALAFHDWIPEAVYTTASVAPGIKGKNLSVETMGLFTFDHLAIQRGFFLELIERVKLNGQVAFVAQPVRALLDLVCLNKLEWQGLDWLLKGMRIDEAALSQITRTQIQILKRVYKYQRINTFVSELEIALGLDLADD